MNYIQIIGFLCFSMLISGHFMIVRQDAPEVFIIPVDQIVVDGSEMDIKPGDSVLLEGGIREQLRFENLKGSSEKPVIIAIKNEKVIVDTEAHTGILFRRSSFVHLTGVSPSEKYGIEIASTGSMGISVTEFSTDFEIDHIEIHNTGFAGIMAKTDPNCAQPDVSDFVMRNLSFHDNHIYDTEGEGFYVGYSWYPSREVDCSGTKVTLYPHAIQGLRIYNNDIHDTGWDGLQVGSATANVKVYGNTIQRFGLEGVEYQTGGVQIGASTTGDLYNNFIYDGVGGGVSFFGGGNNRLYNNVIMNTGGNAVYQNDRDALPGTNYEIYNNTIINPGRAAIDLNTSKTRGNLVANNLIVLGDGFFGITGDDATWKNEGNQLYGKIIEVGFVHSDTLNFRLSAASKAVDAGHRVEHLKFDHDFYARPANEKYDVGAFEYGSIPYEPPPLNISEETSSAISIFPNPSNSGLVNFKIAGNLKPDSVVFFNLSGKAVFDRNIKLNGKTEYRFTIPSELDAGIYLIVFFQENQQIALKKFLINAH